MDDHKSPAEKWKEGLARAREIIAAGDLETGPGVNFLPRLKIVDEMIKLARRLEHPPVQDDEQEAQDLARTLFLRARTTGVNMSVEILRGAKRSPGEMLKLAKLLDRLDEFAVARKVLDKAREHGDFGKEQEERIRIIQKRALYTYKDVNQPLGTRLTDALEFLEKEASLQTTTDQETLGLAGAIYKRKWELDRNLGHLQQSLDYYRKGSEQKPWEDQGYTSINAAYVLDLLASLQKGNAQEAQNRRAEANRIRTEIIELVPKMVETENGRWLANEWFFYSTVGEAYFGLGDFEKAHEWLVQRPANAEVFPPDWEFETSARQIANLVRAQSATPDFTITPAWAAFKKVLGSSTLGKSGDVSGEAVRRLRDGKVGLALSGGGFRASLFHIGVLARLAELDVLRKVEVISCVSGGSIVGAHYYLEVRTLLREKSDAAITKDDYVQIVQRLEADFLAGVQTNIRLQVFTDPHIVRRMMRRDYSRTARLGELYEEVLYSCVKEPIKKGEAVKDDKVAERYMHELVIQPRRSDGTVWEDFKPRNHNWRRETKVPILILNATALNTGHNWQFTATYMGEAPATINREVDSVYRLRRKYYTEAPDSPTAPQKVRLGAAVAASSCVPGLFEPLTFEQMYATHGDKRGIDVKLVDGGVCDNQGVSGLLEQDCTVLLVSDGSGQMNPVEVPSSESLMVALQSNSILQARIRGTQYHDLDSRLSASMLNGLMFVHLKKDLDNTPVHWKDCPPESRLAAPDEREVSTAYGIPKVVQRRLAAIRTDLDSFCDQEAYALMWSGYRMTEYQYRCSIAQPKDLEPTAEQWKFRRIARLMDPGASGTDTKQFTDLLDASGSLFLKVWKLDDALKRRAQRLGRLAGAFVAGIGLVALGALAALVLALWSLVSGNTHVVPAWVLTLLGGVTTAALLGVLASLVAALLIYWRRLRGLPQWGDAVAHYAVGGLLLVVASPAARYYMRKYEQRYLDRGKLQP